MQHESGHSLPIVFLTLAAIRAINFHLQGNRRLAILIKRLCTCLYAEACERFLATIDSHFLWIDETTTVAVATAEELLLAGWIVIGDVLKYIHLLHQASMDPSVASKEKKNC